MGIVGASGFLGGRLAEAASSAGWRVVGFSRRERPAGGAVAEWRLFGDGPDLGGLDAVVNLAGEPVAGRWTAERRERLRESRIGTTRRIVRAIEALPERPAVLLNGSAVGIYGDRGEERLGERSGPGEGFLADLCRDWEREAREAESLGLRVLRWRTGLVLGREAEAWLRMRRVFALGLGGRFGSGRQWMPWVHVDDLVGGMLHALDHSVSGAVNGCAPEAERNADFARELGRVLHRPAVLPAPGWALKLALGEFAGELLASQRAIPEVLVGDGYEFRFPALAGALRELG